MITRSIFVLAAAVALALPCGGQTVNINVSYKVVTNSSGVRPTGVNDVDIRAAFDLANQYAATFYRGFRYNLVEIVNTSDNGQPNGPSQYFNVDITTNNIQAFNNAALADPRYQFRTNAVNLYVTTSPAGGGLCSFPGDPYQVVWINSCTEWWVLAHEIGHYYSLFHTHQGESFLYNDNTACPTDPINVSVCTCPQRFPGNDDLVPDTIPDNECWNRDQAAIGNYGVAYTSLTTAQKKLVDDIYFNLMSYHIGDPVGVGSRDNFQNRFTELQLDRLTDAANGPRAATMSGKTRFVSTTGNDASSGLVSTAPKRTVAAVVTSSAASDLVLLRAGSYNELITINRPVTLRVARDTVANIGMP